MTTPTASQWRSAQPMPSLSKRAQEQLKPRSINTYSRARPVEGKKS